jgi:hypothetical protein
LVWGRQNLRVNKGECIEVALFHESEFNILSKIHGDAGVAPWNLDIMIVNG